MGIGEPDNYIDSRLISTGGRMDLDRMGLPWQWKISQGRQGEWNDLRLAEAALSLNIQMENYNRKRRKKYLISHDIQEV